MYLESHFALAIEATNLPEAIILRSPLPVSGSLSLPAMSVPLSLFVRFITNRSRGFNGRLEGVRGLPRTS
jgi:hypothetical protein